MFSDARILVLILIQFLIMLKAMKHERGVGHCKDLLGVE